MNRLIQRYGTRVWHRHHLWLGFAAVAALLVVAVIVEPRLRSGDILFPVVAAALGLFYFLHQNHLQTARFCKELVTDFNKRYDAVNNRLQLLVRKEGAFSDDETLAFVDYFNLCAEEHLFHEAGYIYEQIWESWHNGMKQYAKDPRVASIWTMEANTNSYYGFEFPVSQLASTADEGGAR